MRGQRVPEHYALTMNTREAETLQGMLNEIDSREDFILNEFEQEIVDNLLELLQSE